MTGAETLGLGWALDKLWVLLIAMLGWGYRNHAKGNEDRDISIKSLEEKCGSFATLDQVKETVNEKLNPYAQNQQDIKDLLKDLNLQIVDLGKDMAVEKYKSNKH